LYPYHLVLSKHVQDITVFFDTTYLNSILKKTNLYQDG